MIEVVGTREEDLIPRPGQAEKSKKECLTRSGGEEKLPLGV